MIIIIMITIILIGRLPPRREGGPSCSAGDQLRAGLLIEFGIIIDIIVIIIVNCRL